jgi:hypothetical protein
MSSTKVVTGKVRFSYLHVFEPSSIDEGSPKKYSASLIIPKSDKATIKKVEDAVAAAIEAGKNKLALTGGKLPHNFKYPMRDGDEERPDDENYAGCMFVNASSGNKPGMVDEDLNPILERESLYSGCFGRASVNFYAFNTSGNKGIACGLNNLQKLEDGPNLGGGGASAESDFGEDLM